MKDDKGYYKALELDPSASNEDIKNSYRNLMKQYHPDVNSSEEAQVKSREINEAYNVLSDNQAKQEYDNGFQGEFYQNNEWNWFFDNFKHNHVNNLYNSELHIRINIT